VFNTNFRSCCKTGFFIDIYQVKKIVFNGDYLDAGTAVASSESRGLRYGDGCFETMKMVNGKIVLKELHFERLFSSLDRLGFELPKAFNASTLEEAVTSLAKKNGDEGYARTRLMVFRGGGGLYDPANHRPNYVIETAGLEKSAGRFNENGLLADIYKEARKPADHFSHIKANSFLPYVVAANWAKKKKLDDAILLNAFDRVADTTIANVFIVYNGVIKTPALTEGCIAGVMRKHLLHCCREEGFPVQEAEITVDELQNATEIFLTNAIRGIRWVKQAGEGEYQYQVSKLLYDKFLVPLWK
jgi:branched-subunit amino acid aminotransferase/4-amino-4-deoxychorismate lyase